MPGEEIDYDSFLLSNFNVVEEEETEAEVEEPEAQQPEEEEEQAETEEPSAESTEEEEATEEEEEETQEESEEAETEEEPEEPTGEEVGGDLTFKPYAEALFAFNGWEFSEELMEEDSLGGFNDLMQNIIKTNVAAATEGMGKFANSEMERLNELVSKGADPKDAFNALFTALDYDNVDVSDTKVAKDIVRRYYKETTAYSDSKIEKTIKRLEDLDELEEEAKEGIDILKQADAKKDKDLEAELERQQEAQIAERQKVLDTKKQSIREAKEIAGYKNDNTLSGNFIDYLFKPDDEGKTEYQKFVEKNPNWDIEAAMFAFKKMNKQKIEAQSETQAVNLLRDRIFGKGKKGTSKAQKPNRVTPKGNNPNRKKDVNFDDFIL
jgi:hypothetical protein